MEEAGLAPLLLFEIHIFFSAFAFSIVLVASFIILSIFSSQDSSLNILENEGADHVEGLNKLNGSFSVEPEAFDEDDIDDSDDDIYHIQRKTNTKRV